MIYRLILHLTQTHTKVICKQLAELTGLCGSYYSTGWSCSEKLLMQNCFCSKKVTLFGCELQRLVSWEVDGKASGL